MMSFTVINMTFSGATKEGVEGFVGLLAENVTHQGYSSEVHEKTMDCADGTKNSYWIGQMNLTVKPIDLNNCLVQIDSVKYGLIPNADDIYGVMFRDTRVEIATESIESITPILEQNKYLHNKVQEQAKAIENLEHQIFNLTKLANGFQIQINALTERYTEHHAFLHDFIDFKSLITVVRETAMKVDEEILDTYPIKMVH